MKPIHVLLAEDNETDVILTREAFASSKLSINLDVVKDGVDLLAFLRREGVHAQAPRPDLILLDLNMPRLSGFEVLEVIKASPDFRRIPVVILTSSAADQDILQSYDLHASCYITKPVDFGSFLKIVASLQDFWFTVVRLPSAEAPAS
ncbi:two-component system response regulator [Deinobacterium chartae]|uniref:Two-component system response regulator n=1 Tax=Deinobacterium chartae TaxID=521158 RepID=A0A841I2T8_9DEIO|nr:response regulator [Deinobacterium chartae]MBB6099376.1 two-component system response regulator [Deinobacterium chartae]